MQQIKDLVATDISRSLFEKIQRGIALQPYKDLYISAQGDDATADGTQDKPFKTIPKLLEFIKVKHGNSLVKNNIVVKFLSDFTDTRKLTFLYTNRWYIIFDANGYNVTLGGAFVRLCNIRFNGITFTPQDDVENRAFEALQASNIFFYNCTFNPCASPTISYFVTRYHSTITFSGDLNLNIGNSVTDDLFSAWVFSILYFEGKINLKQNITCKRIFYVTRQAEASFIKEVVINNNTFTVNASKYLVNKDSLIDTRGKGKDFLLGNQEGVLEQDGKIY